MPLCVVKTFKQINLIDIRKIVPRKLRNECTLYFVLKTSMSRMISNEHLYVCASEGTLKNIFSYWNYKHILNVIFIWFKKVAML